MSHDRILRQVGDYYSQKVETHGASAKGVDWNSKESQFLRFAQLLKSTKVKRISRLMTSVAVMVG
jgi:hypothetical protein